MNTTTSTDNTNTIIVCSDCATGIVNDDWSHLNYNHCDSDDADEAMASIMGSLELWGWLSLLDSNVDTKGYFRCPCCGDDAIDGASFTTTAS